MKYIIDENKHNEFVILFGGDCNLTVESKQFSKILNSDKPKLNKWLVDLSVSIYPYYKVGSKCYDIIDFLFENKPKNSTIKFKDTDKHNLRFNNIEFIMNNLKKNHNKINMSQIDNDTSNKINMSQIDNDTIINNKMSVKKNHHDINEPLREHIVLDKTKDGVPFYKIKKSHPYLQTDWKTNKLKECLLEDKFREVNIQYDYLEKYHKLNLKYKMKKEGVFLPNYFTFQYPKNRPISLCLEKDIEHDGHKKKLNTSYQLDVAPVNGRYEQDYIDNKLIKLKDTIIKKYDGKLIDYNINITDFITNLM
jgi:hypothetical protein